MRTAPPPLTDLELDVLRTLAGEPDPVGRSHLMPLLEELVADGTVSAIILGTIDLLPLFADWGYTAQDCNAEIVAGNMGWFHNVPVIVHGLPPAIVLVVSIDAAATTALALTD